MCRDILPVVRFSAPSLLLAFAWLAAAEGLARADDLTPPNEHAPPVLTGTSPPPTSGAFLQYGVSFSAEFVASAGPMCDDAKQAGARKPDCILGGGGGVAFRVGWRQGGPWYLGGAYEISKQDPNKLYRLAILQQLRGEARYYIDTGREWQPYAGGGLAVAGYGDEWSVDTWGPGASLSIGAELQITRTTLLGFGLGYRILHFSRFVDSSLSERPPGFSHLVGLDLTLEGRDAL